MQGLPSENICPMEAAKVNPEEGQTGERLHAVANCIGYDKFIDMVMTDDILDCKEEILAANLHTVGGATW